MLKIKAPVRDFFFVLILAPPQDKVMPLISLMFFFFLILEFITLNFFTNQNQEFDFGLTVLAGQNKYELITEIK